MKVIICGGRDYFFSDEDRATLNTLHAVWHFSLVLSGGAPGADACGESWAMKVGVPIQRFQADWITYGRAAGPRRNKAMVDYCATESQGLVVAFPGGHGTRNCLWLAKQANLRIFYVGSPITSPGERHDDTL